MEPEGITATGGASSFSPSLQMLPLPNCFSIAPRACTSAFIFSPPLDMGAPF